jgi:hypothetical protein
MAEFLTPPHPLVDKTGRGMPGLGTRLVKKADQAARAHIDRVDYRTIAWDSLERLNQLMQDFSGDPTRADLGRRIYELCHDLRGEGASFGYPSVSRVADLICRVIDGQARRDKRFLEVVKIELVSLRAMVRFNVKGEPKGIALEVIDALDFLVDTLTSRRPG